MMAFSILLIVSAKIILVVEGHTSHMKIGHDFKNNVLITITKSGTKRIGCIGRTGTIQDHRFFIGF